MCGPAWPQSHGGTWGLREGGEKGKEGRQTDRQIRPGSTFPLGCCPVSSFAVSSHSPLNLLQAGSPQAPPQGCSCQRHRDLYVVPPLLFSLCRLPADLIWFCSSKCHLYMVIPKLASLDKGVLVLVSPRGSPK